MVTMLEPCRGMVWYAAYAQDALPDEARLTALQTKAHLGDVGRDIARMATEAHGGMGFTDLLGLHYWFKRISSIARCWADRNSAAKRRRGCKGGCDAGVHQLVGPGRRWAALAERMRRDGYLFLPRSAAAR